jgi:hypothetical protein
MLIDTVLIAVVLLSCGSGRVEGDAAAGVFFTIDILYFGANLLKVPAAAGSRCWSARSPSPCSPPGPRAAS